MSKAAYNISEVARLIGGGRSTIYEWIAAGELPAKKMGRRTIVLATDLQALLDRLPDAVASGAIRAASPVKEVA